MGVIIANPAAPPDAQYLTLATSARLANARVLTAGPGITIVDAGAGSTATITVSGSANGLLLGYASYNPGAQVVTNTTSATFTDVDSTNLSLTFNAPPSGNAIVRLTAVAQCSTNTENYYWNLRTTGGSDVSGTQHIVTGNLQGTINVALVVTGLTPGASTTYRWGHAVTGGATGSIRYGGTPNFFGQAVMEVWGLP